MADRITEEMIDAYLDGELSVEQSAEVEHHLAHDAQLQRQYGGLISLLRQPPVAEPPADLAGRIKATLREDVLLRATDAHRQKAIAVHPQPAGVNRPDAWLSRRTWRVAAVAAGLGLMVGAGAMWQGMRTAMRHPVASNIVAEQPQTEVAFSPWMLVGLAQAANTGSPVQLAPSLVQAMASELALSPVEARMNREPPTLRPAEHAEPASPSESKPRWLPLFPPVQRL